MCIGLSIAPAFQPFSVVLRMPNAGRILGVEPRFAFTIDQNCERKGINPPKGH